MPKPSAPTERSGAALSRSAPPAAEKPLKGGAAEAAAVSCRESYGCAGTAIALIAPAFSLFSNGIGSAPSALALAPQVGDPPASCRQSTLRPTALGGGEKASDPGHPEHVLTIVAHENSWVKVVIDQGTASEHKLKAGDQAPAGGPEQLQSS